MYRSRLQIVLAYDRLGLSTEQMDALRKRWTEEIAELARKVQEEPSPDPESIWRHVYWEGEKR